MRHSPSHTKRLIALCTFTVAIICLLALYREEVFHSMAVVSEWTEGLGVYGPPIFVIVYMISVPLFIPSSPLMLISGSLFGFPAGFTYAFIGNLLGGSVAFMLARSVLNDTLRGRFENSEKFRAMDNAIKGGGVRFAALIRMSPVLPGPLLNYALGATKLRFRDYLKASIGTLPIIATYTIIGSSLQQITTTQLDNALSSESGPALWILIVGIVTTVAVSALLARRANKLLSRYQQTDAVHAST